MWGLVSALPTSLFWIAVGVLALSEFFREKISSEITFGNWAVIIIPITASLFISFYTGIIKLSSKYEFITVNLHKISKPFYLYR